MNQQTNAGLSQCARVKLTWSEWVEMGKQVKKAHKLLLDELVETRPKSGAKAKKLMKALKNLNAVASVLDDLVVEACSDREDASHVFFGENVPKANESERYESATSTPSLDT